MLEIINQKYMNLLFEVFKNPRNLSELSKKGDLTMSVTSNLITRWARDGILTKEKAEEGRGNDLIIQLTDYGKEQTKLLIKINENYKKNKNGTFDTIKKEE
ncbi:MAG: hypothetical protein ACD_79C01208G0001 [uncultured bacterium]|nr:MAG: hypothetical protein ACD_79C01208G0001 [uncultured bacterium]